MKSAMKWLNPSGNEIVIKYVFAVCEVAGLTQEQLFGSSRERPLVKARQLLYACLRDEGLTWLQIARIVNRDHATVIRGVQSVPREAIDDIKALVHGS